MDDWITLQQMFIVAGYMLLINTAPILKMFVLINTQVQSTSVILSELTSRLTPDVLSVPISRQSDWISCNSVRLKTLSASFCKMKSQISLKTLCDVVEMQLSS